MQQVQRAFVTLLAGAIILWIIVTAVIGIGLLALFLLGVAVGIGVSLFAAHSIKRVKSAFGPEKESKDGRKKVKNNA